MGIEGKEHKGNGPQVGPGKTLIYSVAARNSLDDPEVMTMGAAVEIDAPPDDETNEPDEPPGSGIDWVAIATLFVATTFVTFVLFRVLRDCLL